jgi:hypothetical protein
MISFSANIGASTAGKLAFLASAVIRAAAPEGPQSIQDWRRVAVGRILRTMAFNDPGLIETALRRPFTPSSLPPDKEGREAVFAAANTLAGFGAGEGRCRHEH